VKNLTGAIVKDPTQECPNNTITMTCEPAALASIASYDMATGTATITAPKSTTDTLVKCKIMKTNNAEGTDKTHEFEISIKATATVESKCTIMDMEMFPKTIASGFEGEMTLAWTKDVAAAKGEAVVELARQCPGDRYYMECVDVTDT